MLYSCCYVEVGDLAISKSVGENKDIYTVCLTLYSCCYVEVGDSAISKSVVENKDIHSLSDAVFMLLCRSWRISRL